MGVPDCPILRGFLGFFAVVSRNPCFAMGPAPHRVSRGLRASENPEESEKSPERVPRGRAPKVLKECDPEVSEESEKSLKPDFWTLFGLF